MRRFVKFPKIPSGMLPERAKPGRRRAVTRLAPSQATPVQLHGVVCSVFQRNVRPPTAERRERRADLSAARSCVEGIGRERRRRIERNVERLLAIDGVMRKNETLERGLNKKGVVVITERGVR